MADPYNFAAQVEKYAKEHEQQTAVFVVDSEKTESLTYGELCERAQALQAALASEGVRKSDRVLVLLSRGTWSYVVYLALYRLGAVILPGSDMLRASDITYRVRHAQVSTVICAPHVTAEVRTALADESGILAMTLDAQPGFRSIMALTESHMGAKPPCADTDASDVALISYTSGTTAGPKGVVHVHGWARAHLAGAATYWFDVRADEWAWATAGPGWAKWIWSPFVSILGKGGTAFVYNGRFDASVYLALLAQYPIGLLCATPTEYRMMAKSEAMETFVPKALRSAVSAGEPLNREVIDRVHAQTGVWVRDGYGQTENSLLASTQVGMTVRPGSMGRPSPGHDVQIVDEDGKPLSPGEVGDIAVHRTAPTLFREYLYDPVRTAKMFRGEYYITGDLGRLDEDGYLWFEGRSDDIIISAGYTIGPFEVEDALVRHAAVAECAAVASPDEERGHIVKAFVILKSGIVGSDALIQELQAHVRTVTAPYKYPREIEFVDTLPKTASGKIRRVELRALERQRKGLPRK